MLPKKRMNVKIPFTRNVLYSNLLKKSSKNGFGEFETSIGKFEKVVDFKAL
jgi:hypothetical protein